MFGRFGRIGLVTFVAVDPAMVESLISHAAEDPLSPAVAVRRYPPEGLGAGRAWRSWALNAWPHTNSDASGINDERSARYK